MIFHPLSVSVEVKTSNYVSSFLKFRFFRCEFLSPPCSTYFFIILTGDHATEPPLYSTHVWPFRGSLQMEPMCWSSRRDAPPQQVAFTAPLTSQWSLPPWALFPSLLISLPGQRVLRGTPASTAPLWAWEQMWSDRRFAMRRIHLSTFASGTVGALFIWCRRQTV